MSRATKRPRTKAKEWPVADAPAKRSPGHPPSDDPRDGPDGLRSMLRFDSREAALIRAAHRRSGSDRPLAVWLRRELLALCE